MKPESNGSAHNATIVVSQKAQAPEDKAKDKKKEKV